MQTFNGKNVFVVGGTSGIGRSLSEVFYQNGARVTVIGRHFKEQERTNFSFVYADLSLMKNAKSLAEKILKPQKIDYLIFTTGIFAAPKREETQEGIERDLAVSFLNRLLILECLLPTLKHAEIYIWGYPGSKQKGNLNDLNSMKKYSALSAHMNTVAGNQILVKVFSKIYPENVFCGFNPGLIKTHIRDNFLGKNSLKSKIIEFLIGAFSVDKDRYAQNLLPVFVQKNKNGLFFNQKGKMIAPSSNIDFVYAEQFLENARQLIEQSLKD